MKLLTTLALLTLSAAPALAQDMAKADILGADGVKVGQATFTQGTIGALMEVEVEGLPAGKHGMHLHTLGTCEHEHGYKTAKGHIDPDEKEHGYLNEKGPEIGDLPNIIVSEDGKAHIELFLPQIDVSGEGVVILDEDGTSLMIHQDPDDHMTQPIGGSGPRIACGVISAVEAADTTEEE